GNNPRNGCPVCEKHCPQRQTKSDEYLCWNQQHCQRICEQRCENNACDEFGTCCHPSCLGTCTGSTNRDCAVCKDVITMDEQCAERCPNGTLKFMSHRCIEQDQCLRMERPRETLNAKNYPYKPFNGSCVLECPPGYMDEESRNGKVSCKKCEGPCQKECVGTNVDSIASAQQLRGCTHIIGSLEIQIRGGKNIVKELEDSLNTIEVIDGYLKVVRSFPLISLNFLKNLRVIRGNDIDSKYSLLVMDNQNLQELWDWSSHKGIKIQSKDGPGRIFFHLNPKLCLYKIETLRKKAGLGPFTEYDVAPNSNGDKVACNVTELKTKVGKKSPWGAVIEWEPFVHHDARSLLGYVVYFIEAPNRNVTMYDGRDACGGDGWKVDDVSASTNTTETSKFGGRQDKNVHTHYLSQLKPYTQYAYYVKTYTIATERSGAQSNLTYFRTMPEAPSAPRSLIIWSNSSSELIMSWLPPLHKNGNLTHYRIFGRWEPDDPNFIDQRNYCEEPMMLPDKKALAEEERKRMEEEKEQMMPETGSCECLDRETDQSLREKEASSAIEFEDALHNQVYIKRKSKKKRDVSEMSFVSRRTKALDQAAIERIENGTYMMFEQLVPSTNLSFVMKNLRHFAAYNIEVQACRAQEMNDTYKKCSTKSMRTYRTLPLDSADNIPPNTFKIIISGENNSLTMVTLQWDEPSQPNGLIITYQIEYKRVDIQNYKPTVVCITRRDFTKAGNSYVLKELPVGNYSVKVRATSLAGYGAYTHVKYFYIDETNGASASWIILGVVFIVVLRYVIEGGVMERPENCPEMLYDLMKRTWKHKVTRRPTFMDIVAMLLKHIDSKHFQEVSFYHSAEGVEARNQNRSNSPQINQHLELTTLQDLQEEEAEGEEDSPLRQDFGDFASFEPSIKNSFSPRFRMDSYGENSKTATNCHDMNSSNVPLKAGFDDFDGVSADSIASGKDVLNLPFVEDSLKSVKSSPFINAKSVSRSNLSQLSISNRSASPKNHSGKRSGFLSSPNSSKLINPDYENGSPEILLAAEKRETVPLRVDFSSMDAIDMDNGVEKKEPLSPVEYVNKPEALNNGYIGSTAT
ncbi:unnamed protein product, partial [Heterotrigona itama]